MKLSTNSWPRTKGAKNFKFVAEVLLELVAPGTWEAFQCDSSSFQGKLNEATSLLRQVQRKEIPKPSIDPIIEELASSIEGDSIIDEILKKAGIEANQIFLRPKETTEALLRRVLMLNTLVGQGYKLSCEKRIVAFAVSDGKEKDRLVAAAKSYVSSLISNGYDRRHIYFTIRSHFFDDPILRCTTGLLTRFFLKFSEKTQRFTIFISAPRELSLFAEESFKFNRISKVADLPNDTLQLRFKHVFASKDVISTSLNSLDPFAAKSIFESLLQLVITFGAMRPRRQSLRFGTSVYLVDEAGLTKALQRNVGLDIRVSPSLQKRRFDPDADFASYMFDNSDQSTATRLFRSATSAANSLDASQYDTKVVSIWSAFEALLPQPTKDKEAGARIVHFCDLLVPCILFDHFRVVFEVTYRNYRDEFGSPFSDFVEAHGEGSTKAEKFASLVLGENVHQPGLCELLSQSPLALYRLGNLQRTFKEPSAVSARLISLSKKVEWQLHRIYRERNTIGHLDF